MPEIMIGRAAHYIYLPMVHSREQNDGDNAVTRSRLITRA